ncbi:MAG: hypothetical protein LBH75_03555 [Treponema sp.]|jgi:hypothetical protein|nr:hypothetical protein [Treponema sp.]
MKKLMALMVVSVLTAGAVFAQVSLGGDVSSFFIPFRSTIDPDGKVKSTAAVQDSFGGPDLNTSIYIKGVSDLAGFNFTLRAAYGDGSAGGAQTVRARPDMYVWIQPHNILKLSFGTMTDSTLAGTVGASNFAPYVLDPGKADRLELGDSQFNIFTQFNPNAEGNKDGNSNLYAPAVSAAAMITLTPVEGLFIGAFIAPELEGINGTGLGSGTDGDFYDVERIYKNLQFGVGYTIPNIGLARAQYIGWRNVVELAFQLTMIENLNMDFGVKIPWMGDDSKNDAINYKKHRDYQFSLGTDYTAGEFNFMCRVDTAFNGYNGNEGDLQYYDTLNGLDLLVYAAPSYNLGFAKAGLDLGFEYRGVDKRSGEDVENTDGMQFGAGLWLERAFGAGVLKGGVTGRFPLEWQGKEQNTDIFIPIMLSISL